MPIILLKIHLNHMKIINFFILIIILISASCSQKQTLVDDSKTATQSTGPRIDTIENTIFKYEASDSFVDVVIGPLYDSSNNKISPADSFQIYSQVSDLKVGQKNAATLSSFSDSITISPETDGSIKFRAKLPVTESLTNLFIKALNKESAIGKIFFQVEPTAIANIGLMSTKAFQDTAPYNGLKEENESYALVDLQDVIVTVGPIVDRYNNKIKNGSVDIFLVNAMFDRDSLLTSKNVTIDDGFATFNVIAEGDLLTDDGSIPKAQIIAADGSLNVTSTDLSDALIAHPTTVKSNDFSVLTEDVLFTDSAENFNFGVVYIGQSLIKTFTVKNNGNATINSFNVTTEPPFEITGGSCQSQENLTPNSLCTVDVKLAANSRQVNSASLKINGKYSQQPLTEIIQPILGQSAYPANLQIQLENNLVEFPNHPVGELITKSFIVINSGDVPAQNIKFTNPNPYPGQNTGFYTFKSLDASVPNDDPFNGEHCGLTFQPQVKCKVYVDYFPTAKVGNDILAGSIYADEISPSSLFVKGKSYINNFERILGINSAKYKIKKDEADTSEVIIGPLRDLYGVPVANQLVQIELYSWTDASNTIKDYVGNVSSNNIILGGKPNTYTIRTDEQGYANFSLKSNFSDKVGIFTIEANVIDNEGNVLSQGFREFEFIGAKLHFDQEIYNFSKIIIGQVSTRVVTVVNDGSMDALNVGSSLSSSLFSISDEGSCVGIRSNSLNIPVNGSCSFSISITPQLRKSYFDQLLLTSSTIGNKQPSDVYASGVNSLRFNSETPMIIDTKIIGDPTPLHAEITFTNIGDEVGHTLVAFSEKENQSFTFAFNCTTLEVGRSCLLSIDYLPTVIPDPILSTNIVIKGIGSMSNLGAEVKIPIEINHSSMRFANQEPGININACFSLKILAADVENSDLDFSQDVGLFLRTNKLGTYYSDNNCSSSISTIIIPANTYKTSIFYYKPTEPGVHILRGDSNQLSSAIKSFVVYKDPAAIEMVSKNFQNAYVGKQLLEPVVIRVIDEDGKGVPNIPVQLKFLEDISKKTNLVSNGTFASGISGWTYNSAVSWFNGYSGVMKFFSKDIIAEATSGNISVNEGEVYYYTVKVVDSFGTPGSADLIVNLLDVNNNIIETRTIQGKAAGAYSIKIPTGIDTVKLNLKTKGTSRSTLVYIDNVYFSNTLAKVANDPVIYGTVSNEIQSTFAGPGELMVNYQPSKLPIESLINATSNYYSYLSGFNLLIANSVEFQTNIKGSLGDFTLTSSGPSLTRNGVDNLNALQSLSGYNWSAASKTLSLPANLSYDFKTFQTEAGTTVDLKSNTNAAPLDWTSIYAQDSCIIDGKIQNKNFYTDGNAKTYSYGAVDNDVLTINVLDYAIGKRGGLGGERLYQNYYTQRGCSRNWRGKVRCGGWPGWWVVGYGPDSGKRDNTETLNKYNAGSGAKGINNRYFSQADSANRNYGGSGGAKGKNGGLLFINCYKTMAGNGIVDVSGSKGDSAGNGRYSSSYYADSSVWCQAYYHGQCWQMRFDRFLNGYGGGGSGGDGGDGGTVIFKTKADLSSITSNYNGGAGGTKGLTGGVYGPYGYGTEGSTGNNGSTGKCLKLDGNSNILATCDGSVILTVPRSCNELLSRNNALRNQNGIYNITPSGSPSDPTIQVYCDMTADGGGWTMIARSASGATTSATFGWKYGTGSATDDAVPYSLNLSKNKISFSETMLASYTSGKIIQYAYKQQFSLSNMESNQTSAFNLVETPTPIVGTGNTNFRSAIYAGHTNLQNLFFFNDGTSLNKSIAISSNMLSFNNFGLSPNGWFAFISSTVDDATALAADRLLFPSEGYMGFKFDLFTGNTVQLSDNIQGMILVR